MMKYYGQLGIPKPTVTPVSKPFWDAVARHEFVLQKCRDCEEWCFYPRSFCPNCWSERLYWTVASGNGRLKTWCEVHKPGHPVWEEVTPYKLGIVELEEGPTMLSHLLINNQPLKIGLPLHVSYTKFGDTWLPFFEHRFL